MPGAVRNAKSVTIGDFTGTVTVFNSVGSTVTANATDIVRPSDWNSNLNVFVTLSGNTAGQSSVSGTNIVLAGGNNVTLSANTAAGAATISFAAPGGVSSLQEFIQFPFDNNSSFSALGQNTLYLVPAAPQAPVDVSAINLGVSFGGTSSTSGTRQYSETFSACLYQVGDGTNNTVMSSQSSVSASWGVSRFSNSATYSIAINGNSTTTTGVTNFLTGTNILNLPLSTILQQGEVYYLGIACSTATAGVNSGMSAACLGMTDLAATFGTIGSGGVGASNTGNAFNFGGLNHSHTSAVWPASIAFSDLARAPSGYRPYVEFINFMAN